VQEKAILATTPVCAIIIPFPNHQSRSVRLRTLYREVDRFLFLSPQHHSYRVQVAARCPCPHSLITVPYACLEHLCLARSGSRASRASTCRLGVAVRVVVGELEVHDSIDIWDLGLSEGSCSLAAGRTLAIFLVGGNVEGDKEEEV
jgi:hypothetical protein